VGVITNMMLIILLAIAAFGLIHSLLAGQRVKQWASRRFGQRSYEGFYRLAYNVLAALTILPVIALVALRPGAVVWQVDTPLLRLLLNGLRLAGAAGLGLSLIQIDLGRFAGLSQALAYFRGEPLPLPPEPLQTRGLYRFVRHPLYFFSLLALWPAPTMTETLLAFNIGATLYFIIGSRYEERRMLASYGDAYRRYQKQVPWLLPRFRHANSENTHQLLV